MTAETYDSVAAHLDNNKDPQASMSKKLHPFVVFDHMAKCAGTTFCIILKEAYGPGYVSCNTAEDLLYLRKRLPILIETGTPLAIAGHAAWGQHIFGPPDSHPLLATIVRHPLQLFRSHHTYTRSMGQHQANVFDYLAGYKDNPLTDWYGGGDLDRAITRLDAYGIVGLVERFNDTLSLFSRMAGADVRTFSRQNVSSKPHEVLPPEFEEAFLELQNKDMAIYKYACHRLEEDGKRFHHLAADFTVPGVPPERRETVLPKASGESAWREGRRKLTQSRELLQQGRNQECVALLREVWNTQRDQQLKDLIELLASFDLPEALNWLEELVPELPPCNREVPDSCGNIIRQHALFLLAELTLRAGDAESADRLHEQAFLTSPDQWQAVQRHAVHCRTRGRHEQALRLLEAHPCARDTYKMFCEIAVTSFLAHGKEGMRDRVNKPRQRFAPHIRLRSQARAKAMGPDWQRIALEELAAPRRMILFSSAPLALCCEAAEQIRMRFPAVRIEALAQPHVVAALEPRVDVVHPLPAGMFVSARAKHALRASTFARAYDLALLPMSSNSLDSYAEYLRFAREYVEGRIVAYPLENLFRDEKRGWVRDVAPPNEHPVRGSRMTPRDEPCNCAAAPLPTQKETAP